MIPKFRAWDKVFKEMVQVNALVLDKQVVKVTYKNGNVAKEDMKEYELMQSTGLKDKNGKEVFEGDILSIETDEGIFNVNIFWDDKHALFMFESEIHNEKELLAELVEDNTYPFEIIGNIYENPELLNPELLEVTE